MDVWIEPSEFVMPKRECCMWKNPLTVIVNSESTQWMNGAQWLQQKQKTMAGLPLIKFISWCIKVLESKRNSHWIYIGVSLSDASKNAGASYRYEQYFDCHDSTLWLGPPHNHRSKEYVPRKEGGEYIHTGDNVGVVVDTTKGELSFTMDGVNFGVAYEGIPLDKPFVPCVLLLGYKGDSVELII